MCSVFLKGKKIESWWSWFWYDLGSYLQFSKHGGFCYQILAYALLSWFVSGIWFEAAGCNLHLYMKLLDIAICGLLISISNLIIFSFPFPICISRGWGFNFNFQFLFILSYGNLLSGTDHHVVLRAVGLSW